MREPGLRRYGEEVTRSVLGVDTLYRRDATRRVPAPESGHLGEEGLVAVNLSELLAKEYAGWPEAISDWEALRRRAEALVDASRRAYYEDLATSMLALVSWSERGAGHPAGSSFSEFGARILGLERLAFTSDEWEGARTSLQQHLHSAGYRDRDWRAALSRWEEERRVPASEVVPTLNELLAAARMRVEERMFALPPGRAICAVGVRNVAYSAYCDYVGGEMQVNLDQPYTLPELRHLVAHEAYPGHYTHLAVREAAAETGEATQDVLLVITDTPTSPIFEGIGDNGLDFCWDVEPDDAVVMALFRMRILAVCRAAVCLAAGEPPESVRAKLVDESAGHPAWVDQRLRFLSYPLRRPFIFAYAWGERVVADVYRTIPPTARPSFFGALYRHHHSPRSLRALQGGVSAR